MSTTDRDRALALAEKLLVERVRRGDTASITPRALQAWAAATALGLAEAVDAEIASRQREVDQAAALEKSCEEVLKFMRAQPSGWFRESEIVRRVLLTAEVSHRYVIETLYDRSLLEMRDTTDVQARRVAEFTRERMPKEYRLLDWVG